MAVGSTTPNRQQGLRATPLVNCKARLWQGVQAADRHTMPHQYLNGQHASGKTALKMAFTLLGTYTGISHSCLAWWARFLAPLAASSPGIGSAAESLDNVANSAHLSQWARTLPPCTSDPTPMNRHCMYFTGFPCHTGVPSLDPGSAPKQSLDFANGIDSRIVLLFSWLITANLKHFYRC